MEISCLNIENQSKNEAKSTVFSPIQRTFHSIPRAFLGRPHVESKALFESLNLEEERKERKKKSKKERISRSIDEEQIIEEMRITNERMNERKGK